MNDDTCACFLRPKPSSKCLRCSHTNKRAVDGRMRRFQLVQIMITRRSAGSGVDKSTNKTTIHTASFSVRCQKAKTTRIGNHISWPHLAPQTPKHRTWSDCHCKLRSEISISCTAYLASEQSQIQGRRMSKRKPDKDGECPSESQTHGQRHNLCFLLSSTAHDPWKLDQSPHDTVSKAPTDSARRSHLTVFSTTRESQPEHPRQCSSSHQTL